MAFPLRIQVFTIHAEVFKITDRQLAGSSSLPEHVFNIHDLNHLTIMKIILPILLVLFRLLKNTAALSMLDVAGQCADTSGFNSCWNNALSDAQSCYQRNCQGEGTCTSEADCTSSNANCVQICSCQAYSNMINCALTSCWNMVYLFSTPKSQFSNT